jgi:hypothetical protein
VSTFDGEILGSAQTRAQRLQNLKDATLRYVTEERKRLKDEAAALEKVLSGRTGGKALQSVAVDYCSAVARKDLESFLRA